jgi:hypothetical protein
MVTLRIHLDDTPAANAPLLIAPGSHALGKVPKAASNRSSPDAAAWPAWPKRATYGLTPHRSCTPRRQPHAPQDDASCKWISAPTACPAGWNGWASDDAAALLRHQLTH